jgi:ParB family transcriptional regulator, chromosome partitioning protein
MARKPLGRGLSALLGDAPQPERTEASGLHEIDIDLIDPNPEQPRTRFAEAALEELAQSIRANGIVQPLVVRRNGARYQIVAGERRWRAAQKSGLRRVPVVVREIADEKLLEIALIENIQRHELNPVEEARAYRKLIDTIGFRQEELAERIGKERSLIATALRMLKLPPDLLQLIEEEKISASHGRVLLTTEDPSAQRQVARAIMDFGLSVRETERMIKKLQGKPAVTVEKKEVKPEKDANVRAAEDKLRQALGTNVKIYPSGKDGAGRIEIEYYNVDDLDRLYQRLYNSKEA